MMLRPVPLGTPGQDVPSNWSPVQRVSGEIQVGTEGAPVQIATLERPQPVSFVPSTQAGTVPGEMIVSTAQPMTAPDNRLVPTPMSSDLMHVTEVNRQDGPMKSGAGNAANNKPARDNGKNKRNGTLPMPRAVDEKKGNTTSHKGWPDLPPPMITHPPHAPREFAKHALSAYIIEPPDVLEIVGAKGVFDDAQPLAGEHLVRPDGTIGLGTYGAVFVSGMTIDQAKVKIIEKILTRQTKLDPGKAWEALKVEVVGYNSKFYYIITDGGGYGEQVYRIACTGNETVLDAVAKIQGLPVVASKKRIWLARATPYEHHPLILPIDWSGIVQRGSAVTNYQVFPGDRLYVNSDKRIWLDSQVAKILGPIERLFGITLLGATTVNAIKGNQGGNNVP